MAHKTALSDWLSAQQASALLGISERGFRKLAEREMLQFREQPTPGGGPVRREYHISVLPAAAREELARLQLENDGTYQQGRLEGRKLRAAKDASDTSRDLARQAGLARYAALPDSLRQIIDARAAVLASWGDFQEQGAGGVVNLRKRFRRLFNERKLDLAPEIYELASQRRSATLSESTLARWEKALNEGGLAALAPAYGKESSREYASIIETNPLIQKVVLGMIDEYGPHLNAKMVHDRLTVKFGDAAPARRTVQEWLASWRKDNKKAACYLDSPEKWRGKFVPSFGDRDGDVDRPNQVWELDSTLADIALLELLPDGTLRERRHSLLAVLDVYTRNVLFLVSETSSSAAIGLLLRRAILKWGIPKTLRMDNGKDYSSVLIEGLAASLGISIHRCRPFEPQEKPFVERIFKTLQHGYLTLLDGYVGHSVAERQKLRARAKSKKRTGDRPAYDLGSAKYTPEQFQEIVDH